MIKLHFQYDIILSTHKTLTYSSSWRNLSKMEHFHSWTPKYHQVPTKPSSLVYRKPTNTDQYLYWDSNQFIRAKYSVFNISVHRAKVVSHNQQSLHKELDNIRKALHACHSQTWTLNSLQQKFEHKTPNQQWTKFHGYSTKQHQQYWNQ